MNIVGTAAEIVREKQFVARDHEQVEIVHRLTFECAAPGASDS